MTEDYIPFEIQAEIMKRLPVKSLIRFTSVSKPWKSLIHSSKFIRDHHSMQQHHVLIHHDKLGASNSIERTYVSIVDDDMFPHHKIFMAVPMSVKLSKPSRVFVGSSRGLLCAFCYNENTAIIWNPTIKKSVAIDVPNMLNTRSCTSVVGFGVCPRTSDPMLVKVTFDATNPCQVEVFKLSLGFWGSRPRSNLPCKSTMLLYYQVVINECIYWLAYDYSYLDGKNHIYSFDMTREEFTEVYLPESLASSKIELVISEIRESLVVVENNASSNVTVWTMQNYDPKSFTKLFTINKQITSIIGELVYRKSGGVIMVKKKYITEDESFVSEPNSQEVNYLWVSEESYLFYRHSYKETLLLLDHKDNGNFARSETYKSRGLDWASKVWRLIKSYVY